MFHPVLFLGIDIAYRRDTAAISATYRDPELGKICRFGHKIWEPPVHIPDVTDCVLHLLATQRVGAILYDPAQYVGEVQRLIEKGYEAILHEVNQQTMMVEMGNCLQAEIMRKDYWPYSDIEVRGQYSWTNAEATERGYRIVKRKQTKPIDIVVAEAMSVYGCKQDFGYMSSPAYNEEDHAVAVEDFV